MQLVEISMPSLAKWKEKLGHTLIFENGSVTQKPLKAIPEQFQILFVTGILASLSTYYGGIRRFNGFKEPIGNYSEVDEVKRQLASAWASCLGKVSCSLILETLFAVLEGKSKLSQTGGYIAPPSPAAFFYATYDIQNTRKSYHEPNKKALNVDNQLSESERKKSLLHKALAIALRMRLDNGKISPMLKPFYNSLPKGIDWMKFPTQDPETIPPGEQAFYDELGVTHVEVLEAEDLTALRTMCYDAQGKALGKMEFKYEEYPDTWQEEIRKRVQAREKGALKRSS